MCCFLCLQVTSWFKETVGDYRGFAMTSYLRPFTKSLFPRMFSNDWLFVLADAPQREFLTSPTDCGPAMSLRPLFMSLLSQWCNSPATWPRAQTGEKYTSCAVPQRQTVSDFLVRKVHRHDVSLDFIPTNSFTHHRWFNLDKRCFF